ncbi:MAG TPA: HAD family hydrolase [Candidatus Competibacter sp.]|nr:HAD family hydrolase [Candidatus Competibacter sp.]
MIDTLLFDWGNTVMIDFPDEVGPMYSWNRLELVDGAEACLKKLSSNYLILLATNAKDSTKEDIRKALDRVGIGRYFNEIVCFKEVGFPKPTREFFDFVLNRTRKKKSELIMIGDDLEKDYWGPRAFGINAVLYDPFERYRDVEMRVSSLAEIEELIARINRWKSA